MLRQGSNTRGAQAQGPGRRSRFLILSFFVMFCLVVVVVRLFSVQVLEHEYYKAAGDEERMTQRVLRSKRGEIYMMDGKDATVPVVMNEQTWTVFVDPSYVKNKTAVQEALTEILGDSLTAKWSEVWQDMKKKYIVLAKGVDYETMARIKERNLQGVGQTATTKRAYPAGSLAAQVLGFVNAEGIGTGLEGSLNNRLKGEDGLLKTVTDVNDIPLSIGDNNVEVAARDGENIVLTLDENVQRRVEKILEAAMTRNGGISKASAVVMNPNNGQIYAMANYPSYNPGEYWKVGDAGLYTNRVTESAYEPASVCKTFTYATALNEGKISPSDTYVNTGSTEVYDRTIKNSHYSKQFGTISFQTALDYSLNTGSVEVLRRIGGDNSIPKHARVLLYGYFYNRFGLGQKTGVELYEEAGRVISPEEVEGNAVRYANMTFGQGMNLTMIQVLAGFSSVVNGGKYYQPTVVAGVLKDGRLVKAEEKEALRQTISADTSATMRTMLNGVRSVNGGAADIQGYSVGVKTGTAETYDESGSYTSNKTIASAVGFGGERGDGALPQYVIMVRLDGNTLLWGAESAVPVFTEISNFMIQYLRLRPSE